MFKASTCQLFLVAALAAISSGCRYDAINDTTDVVDDIINGDARRAAKKCAYPLRINLSPLIPDIQSEKEFIRWFPVVFDSKARCDLLQVKTEEDSRFGHHWQGECFGRGDLWRKYGSDQLEVVNIVSPSLFDLWQREYRKSLLTLSPKYRKGCVWDAYYFISEDGAYFGRVDSLGQAWTHPNDINRKDCYDIGPGDADYVEWTEPGVKVSTQFQILLFKKGQRTNDEPVRTFYYDSKDDPMFANRGAGEIVSQRNDFSFFDISGDRIDITYEMSLTFGGQSGRETDLRLKKTVWPPPNAGK